MIQNTGPQCTAAHLATYPPATTHDKAGQAHRISLPGQCQHNAIPTSRGYIITRSCARGASELQEGREHTEREHTEREHSEGRRSPGRATMDTESESDAGVSVTRRFSDASVAFVGYSYILWAIFRSDVCTMWVQQQCSMRQRFTIHRVIEI